MSLARSVSRTTTSLKYTVLVNVKKGTQKFMSKLHIFIVGCVLEDIFLCNCFCELSVLEK